mmetsp:Transcript_139052/g.432614  ORF Transcript_139052/g.432614 Transcript_139052/m.432614 type:complete len:289 (-) Transcript_139052:190-1056(-)
MQLGRLTDEVVHLPVAVDVAVLVPEDVLGDAQIREVHLAAGMPSVVDVDRRAVVDPASLHGDVRRKVLNLRAVPKLPLPSHLLRKVVVVGRAVSLDHVVPERQNVVSGPGGHAHLVESHVLQTVESRGEGGVHLHGVQGVEVGVRADARVVLVVVEARQAVEVERVDRQVHEGHSAVVDLWLGVLRGASTEDDHVPETPEAGILKGCPQVGQDPAVVDVRVHDELEPGVAAEFDRLHGSRAVAGVAAGSERDTSIPGAGFYQRPQRSPIALPYLDHAGRPPHHIAPLK